MTARLPWIVATAALFAVEPLAVDDTLAGPANPLKAPVIRLPASATVAEQGPDWIVGARATPAAGRLARSHGARPIDGRGWQVRRDRARPLAAALRARGLLEYAEPDRRARLAGTTRRSVAAARPYERSADTPTETGRSDRPDPPADTARPDPNTIPAQVFAPDPLSFPEDARSTVVGDAIPPPVSPDSPLIAVIDTPIDASHPEVAQGSNIAVIGSSPPPDFHGTATTSIAAAPANGIGMIGVWPGARAVAIPFASSSYISCSDSARAIDHAIDLGADVINMSYGSPRFCRSEQYALERAHRAGVIAVAASGNEADAGNAPEFPASLPHVLTVGAIGPDGRPTSFSSSSAAVDLSAIGVGVIAAVPPALDPDGDGDGYSALSGTSFASPMVAATAAWIRAARPELTPFQTKQVIRYGTREVGRRGYESESGFGALWVPGALARKAPRDDPAEPNDDIRQVDGRSFGAPAPVRAARGTATIQASIDLTEDPIDIYRVRVRPGARMRARLRNEVGDADLYAYGPGARSVRGSSSLARSKRRGSATDSVAIVNRSGRARIFYIVVAFDADKQRKLANASYTVRVVGGS